MFVVTFMVEFNIQTNSWILKANFCAANLLQGITFICQSWELYFTPYRLLSYPFSTAYPLPVLHSSSIPLFLPILPTSTHCILAAPWKYQLNGAGLVSSASSRASVSLQGLHHLSAQVSHKQVAVSEAWELSCPWMSIYISPLQWGQVTWSWKVS